MDKKRQKIIDWFVKQGAILICEDGDTYARLGDVEYMITNTAIDEHNKVIRNFDYATACGCIEPPVVYISGLMNKSVIDFTGCLPVVLEL